ncbi:MAG TPA: carbonic anhydrase family protein [Usitatibacter sp.]|jgi:carbonic anhydrase|nr:carbonic anhydrase family protein [Usitatibacter sp.]
MKRLTFSIAISIALGLSMQQSAANDEAHWSYDSHHGPRQWGDMKEDFATCKVGHEQSPIDIHVKQAKAAPLEAIRFDYKPAPLKIIDNGHTVQVNYAPGSSITINGSRYELVQFHFHKPSEEKIDGKADAMVVHLVHRNAEGKLAVVAVLVDAGREDALIKTLWANVPKEKEKEASPAGVMIDASSLLPASRAYYTFNGSLTTPPCSEGVTWFVLKTPLKASKGQIAEFGKLYPANARPVQPLNGRVVQSSP